MVVEYFYNKKATSKGCVLHSGRFREFVAKVSQKTDKLEYCFLLAIERCGFVIVYSLPRECAWLNVYLEYDICFKLFICTMLSSSVLSLFLFILKHESGQNKGSKVSL